MAKRKFNWEHSKKKRFPGNRRGNLYVNQGHAFDHWSDRCRNNQGQIPNPPQFRDMACPICGYVKGFNQFTEDHCPQKGAQSDFGGPSCVVLVCKDCNGKPGRTYESRSSVLKKGQRSPDNRIAYAEIGMNGEMTVRELGDRDQTATNQKTAFLVAFAVLGYSFALHPSYNDIRASIQQGTVPPTGGPIPAERLHGYEDESVYEHTNGVVVVVGRGFGWMIVPSDVPSPGETTERRWPWPDTHSCGDRREFEGHLSAGNLFHADYCHQGDHYVQQQLAGTS